jgi:hypothetical protein
MRLPKLALLLMISVMLAPAHASVIYNLTQVGAATTPTGPTSVVFGAQFVVTDEAAANGFNFAIRNTPGGPVTASIDGLLALRIVIINGVRNELDLSLADYLKTYQPSTGYLGRLALVAAPGATPTGSFDFTAQVIDVRASLFSDGTFTGSTRADGGIPCFFAACSSAGVVTVAVPEPASLGLMLFGLGLLAAFGASRRRIPAVVIRRPGSIEAGTG